jgi:hypothetical protein
MCVLSYMALCTEWKAVDRTLRLPGASSLPRCRTSMRAPIYSYERGAIVAFAPLVLLVLPKRPFTLWVRFGSVEYDQSPNKPTHENPERLSGHFTPINGSP